MTISDSEIAQIVRIAANPGHLTSDETVPAYFARQVKRLVNRLRIAELAATYASHDMCDPDSTWYTEHATKDLKAEGKLLDV